jgi:hypothetical protein
MVYAQFDYGAEMTKDFYSEQAPATSHFDLQQEENYNMHTNSPIATKPISYSQFNAFHQTSTSELDPETSLMGYAQVDCGAE